MENLTDFSFQNNLHLTIINTASRTNCWELFFSNSFTRLKEDNVVICSARNSKLLCILHHDIGCARRELPCKMALPSLLIG